jgi:hypothetical protein
MESDIKGQTTPDSGTLQQDSWWVRLNGRVPFASVDDCLVSLAAPFEDIIVHQEAPWMDYEVTKSCSSTCCWHFERWFSLIGRFQGELCAVIGGAGEVKSALSSRASYPGRAACTTTQPLSRLSPSASPLKRLLFNLRRLYRAQHRWGQN